MIQINDKPWTLFFCHLRPVPKRFTAFIISIMRLKQEKHIKISWEKPRETRNWAKERIQKAGSIDRGQIGVSCFGSDVISSLPLGTAYPNHRAQPCCGEWNLSLYWSQRSSAYNSLEISQREKTLWEDLDSKAALLMWPSLWEEPANPLISYWCGTAWLDLLLSLKMALAQ